MTNKAGHSFPSGVGFRRAFLNFQVLTGADDVLWASGNVAHGNSEILNGLKGVIVNGKGVPLLTETFTPSQQRFQPHYWERNPITREDQVQIYEELVRNPEGFLTTSFLALNQKAKDNRLQPQGWSSTGPEAAETAPVGICVADAPALGAPVRCLRSALRGRQRIKCRAISGADYKADGGRGEGASYAVLPDDTSVLPVAARNGRYGGGYGTTRAVREQARRSWYVRRQMGSEDCRG